MVKNLVLVDGHYDGHKYQTVLFADPRDECLYAEFRDYNEDTVEHCCPEFTTVELAVNVDEMIRIRDWLNNRIEKIQKRNE